jgi:hypothetical protein
MHIYASHHDAKIHIFPDTGKRDTAEGSFALFDTRNGTKQPAKEPSPCPSKDFSFNNVVIHSKN